MKYSPDEKFKIKKKLLIFIKKMVLTFPREVRT